MKRSYPRFDVRNASSPVVDIDNLILLDLPDPCAVAVKQAIRVGKTLILVGEDGQLFWPSLSPWGRSGGMSYSCQVWPWTNDLMAALRMAGVITEAQEQEHIACARENDRKRDLKHAQEMVEKYAAQVAAHEHGDLAGCRVRANG